MWKEMDYKLLKCYNNHMPKSTLPEKAHEDVAGISVKKEMIKQAALAAPGILTNIKELKDHYSTGSDEPGIAATVMEEVTSVIGETLVDLAFPILKIGMIGWKIRAAIKTAQEKIKAKVYDLYVDISNQVTGNIHDETDRNNPITTQRLKIISGKIDGAKINKNAPASEQRAALVEIIRLLQETEPQAELQAALQAGLAMEKQAAATESILKKMDSQAAVMEKLTGLTPNDEKLAPVEVENAMNALKECQKVAASQSPARQAKSSLNSLASQVNVTPATTVAHTTERVRETLSGSGAGRTEETIPLATAAEIAEVVDGKEVDMIPHSALIAKMSPEANKRAAGLSPLSLKKIEDEVNEGARSFQNYDMCCFAYRLVRELQIAKNGKGEVDFGNGYRMQVTYEMRSDGLFDQTKPSKIVLQSPAGFLHLVQSEHNKRVMLNGQNDSTRLLTTDQYRNDPTMLEKRRIFADILSVALVAKEQQKRLQSPNTSTQNEEFEQALYKRMERVRPYWDNPLTLTTCLSRELLMSAPRSLWTTQKTERSGDYGGLHICNGKIALPNGITITLKDFTCNFAGNERSGEITIEDGKSTVQITCSDGSYRIENRLNGVWMDYHSENYGAVESGMRLMEVIESLKRFRAQDPLNPPSDE